MLCQSHTTKNRCISKDLSLDKIASKNAHFEAWLKLSKLKISFYYIFTLHRKWGNLWKLNAIIMWSFDRRCFFLDIFHHFIGVFLEFYMKNKKARYPCLSLSEYICTQHPAHTHRNVTRSARNQAIPFL